MQNYSDQLKGFHNLYHISNIPFVIASLSGAVLVAYPEGTEGYFNAEYWVSSRNGNVKERPADEVSVFEVGEFCHAAVVKLDTNLFLTTLPVRSSDNVSQHFYTTLIDSVSKDRQADFFRLLHDIPPKTANQLAEFASLAKLVYCSEPANIIHFVPYIPEYTENMPGALQLMEEISYENAPAHLPLDYERAITDAIRRGDRPALEDALNRPTRGEIGEMSLNPIRQQKYKFVCAMFFSCRAAIEGGVPEDYAFSLSDSFCKQMDGMTQVKEIEKLLRKCMLYFCENVSSRVEKKSYSAYTGAAIDYINRHLLEPLSVETISEQIGLNRKSLTQYFMADLDMTIPAYITEKRLTEAAYLLKNTGMSLSAISEVLQFSSQSHFTKRFREKYSVTPHDYRAKC